MTKTNQPASEVKTSDEDFDVENLMDTIRTHSREFTIGAIAVIAIGGGLFLWRQSSLQKEARAEQALNDATFAIQSGNRPLAMADLGKVIERYRDTPAGVEASLISAQLSFEDAKYDDGVKVLEAVKKSSAITNFAAEVDGLIGGAYADQKKYDAAAKQYLAAADESKFQAMKDFYQADAARVLAIAGKKDEARKLWEGIASRPDSPALGEAKVRLGELTAAPAKN